jgi:predicted adenylyl cyclase CyaB
MPSNIEIKAILRDRASAEATAARLSDVAPEIIHQEDFFFNSERARLKLRIFSPERGELIRYERRNLADARCSRYVIARTPDPQALFEILKATFGLAGVVRKKRILYLIGQTRVHIDEVEELGEFLEFEAVLRPYQSETEGKEIVSVLLSEFGIEEQDLVGEAYVDLLGQRGCGRELDRSLPL